MCGEEPRSHFLGAAVPKVEIWRAKVTYSRQDSASTTAVEVSVAICSKSPILYLHNVKRTPLLWLHNKSRLLVQKNIKVKWFGISLVLMAAWRYEIIPYIRNNRNDPTNRSSIMIETKNLYFSPAWKSK